MRTYVCDYNYLSMHAVVHIAGGGAGTGKATNSQILYDLYAPTRIYVYTYIPTMWIKFPTNPFHQKLQRTHPTKKTIFLPSTKYIYL